MSKLSTRELDLEIQLSLVAKIRQAARQYKAEPAGAGSAALESYIAALETLAQHIEAKCRAALIPPVDTLPAQRLRRQTLSDGARSKTGQRVIPFPAASGTSPLTAA